MELYTIKLEDGKDYYVIDTIVTEKGKYAIFSSENKDNFPIRKVVIHDGEECFTTLDSKEEYAEIWSLFLKKHEKGEN